MGEIVPFRPRVELNAEANLRNFIALCRDEITIFGADLPFDDNVWDVSDFFQHRGFGGQRFRIYFTILPSQQDKDLTPFTEPFLSFAKSYIRFMHGLNPSKAVCFRLKALRAVYAALSEGDSYNPNYLNAAIFNRAAQIVKDQHSSQSANLIGCHLERLASFITENLLSITPITWRNFLMHRDDEGRVGLEFDLQRQLKLPSEAALAALPKIFHLATAPADVLVSSVAAILCSAPSRISEVLTLPVDCEVSEKRRENPHAAYGLRWTPAKGAKPMIKWISPSMSSVAQEAIKRIKGLTDESRRISKWYENNPGCIYLKPESEHLRNKKLLDLEEVGQILGQHSRPGKTTGYFDIPYIKSRGKTFIKFEDLQRVVVSMLPKGFPIFDAETGLKYSEALFVLRKNEIGAKGLYYCLIEPITIHKINIRFGSEGHRGSSIFLNHGFTEPDGSPIKVTTHQFRHYLNTLAQSGGLSQLDIAKWSGRKDIRQNRVYDHVTSGEMLQKIRDAVGDENMFGPLAKLPKKMLIPRDEFARLVIPTAHTTDIGYCIHDFTMSPCQLHLDCIHCQSLVCVKGDVQKTEMLRNGLEEAKRLLRKAEAAVEDGYAGSDRWLVHHQSTMERLSQLCALMDDPQVPVGSIIQLAAPTSDQKRSAINAKHTSRIGS